MPTVTEQLQAGPEAAPELLQVVYAELRAIAAGHLARERSGHTLQPTALVHEAYLRLLAPADRDAPQWNGRGHFFAAASQAMRRILVESARRKQRAKHGGGRVRETLDPDRVAEPEAAEDLLALDAALDEFARQEPVIAELVTLRYFGGLTLKDAAAALDIPLRTASSYWAFARAWLQAEIERDGPMA
jgi:RNA polymerase sigma factor (TIGR02999 family)